MKIESCASRAAIAAALFFGSVSGAHAQAVLTPVAAPVAPAPEPDSQGVPPGDDIIVTGTRATGVYYCSPNSPVL